jgi:hypothetical protein
MKRDWRLLIAIFSIAVAGGVLAYELVDSNIYLHNRLVENHGYFENRFSMKRPTDCYDCWPPLRTSFLEVGIGLYVISLFSLLFIWWKPKP